MIIKAGYVCKDSIRIHPIKNLIIKPFGWKTMHLSVGSVAITKICNNNKELEFIMEPHNSVIKLLVNDMTYYSSEQLFDYDINIDIDESKYLLEDIITFIDGTIYDC